MFLIGAAKNERLDHVADVCCVTHIEELAKRAGLFFHQFLGCCREVLLIDNQDSDVGAEVDDFLQQLLINLQLALVDVELVNVRETVVLTVSRRETAVEELARISDVNF